MRGAFPSRLHDVVLRHEPICQISTGPTQEVLAYKRVSGICEHRMTVTDRLCLTIKALVNAFLLTYKV
jgi:hypothetical protein